MGTVKIRKIVLIKTSIFGFSSFNSKNLFSTVVMFAFYASYSTVMQATLLENSMRTDIDL